VLDVQRVDYVRVAVTDMEKANHFYGEVLGLERNPTRPLRTGSSTRPAT
jgi:catechol-2,3-dioxygenase